MKKNLIKRLVSWAFLLGVSGSAMAQAPAGMVLVAGTDFTATGYEKNTYVGFDETDQEGLTDGTFKTSVTRIDKDTKVDGVAWDYETGASDFHDTPHYAVTNNPIKLDSAAYMDMGEKNWYMVFSTPGSTKDPLFTYSAEGFKSGSKVTVKIKFCRLIDTKGQIKGQKKNNGGICQYEPLQGKVRVNQDFSSENIHKDADLNIADPGDCKEIEISTVASSGGKVIVDFVPQFQSSCCAYFIDYIYIYGTIAPEVKGEEEVCAGGEHSVLYLNRTYTGVTYQWFNEKGAIAGATESTYSHESGSDKDVSHTYYCQITTPSGEKIKSSSWTIKDIECCSDANGNPMSQKMIWLDDFGTFTSATNYWTWDYSKISEPKKVQHTDGKNWQHSLEKDPEEAKFYLVGKDGVCTDGEKFIEGRYTVAANVHSYDGLGNDMGWVGYFGNGKQPKENGFAFAPDHTYGGSDYGAMLYLNVGSEPDAVIYSRTIDGLCDRKITVKCYINCFSKSTNPVKVYVKVTDLTSGKEYRSASKTRYANDAAGLGWECPSVSLQLTGTSIKFEIISEVLFLTV